MMRWENFHTGLDMGLHCYPHNDAFFSFPKSQVAGKGIEERLS